MVATVKLNFIFWYTSPDGAVAAVVGVAFTATVGCEGVASVVWDEGVDGADGAGS